MSEILFFSSPIGLGHVTRDFAIAEYLKDVSKKFVTGNGAAKFLKREDYDVDSFYIPPKFIIKNGQLENPLKWIWKYYSYYKQCKKISIKVIEKEKPKLIVSDEDFASLSVAQEKALPTVLITDILESKFTHGFASIIEKKMNKSMKKIIDKCNLVILPEYGNDENNIKRIGPIVRSTKNSREDLRKKFSFDKKTILVSVGGTDAGKFLINKILKSNYIKQNNLEIAIVSGPSINDKYSEKIRNLGFVNNLHELIFASDLVISLAGKSTIDEARSYGTPGIFIPIKNHFEQEDNAREEGFSFDDINRLDSIIPEKLEEKRNPKNYDGDKKAAELITNIFKTQI